MGARVDLASDLGIAPGNTAQANSTAYRNWRDDLAADRGVVSRPSHTLLFDVPGTYSFASPTALHEVRRLSNDQRSNSVSDYFDTDDSSRQRHFPQAINIVSGP